jgi:hypothetical protein
MPFKLKGPDAPGACIAQAFKASACFYFSGGRRERRVFIFGNPISKA